MIEISKPKFPLGKLVATPGALEALVDASESPMDFLSRHVRGDWGECCEEDRQANEDALRYGARLLSVYRTSKGQKIWIITEERQVIYVRAVAGRVLIYRASLAGLDLTIANLPVMLVFLPPF